MPTTAVGMLAYLEEPALNLDGVAGDDRYIRCCFDFDSALRRLPNHRDVRGPRPRRHTAGDCNGLTHIHAGDVWIAAGRGHLSEDVERTVVENLDRYLRVDDVVAIESRGDIRPQLRQSATSRVDLAEERHGDVAGPVDLELARDIILTEH